MVNGSWRALFSKITRLFLSRFRWVDFSFRLGTGNINSVACYCRIRTLPSVFAGYFQLKTHNFFGTPVNQTSDISVFKCQEVLHTCCTCLKWSESDSLVWLSWHLTFVSSLLHTASVHLNLVELKAVLHFPLHEGIRSTRLSCSSGLSWYNRLKSNKRDIWLSKANPIRGILLYLECPINGTIRLESLQFNEN